MKYQCRQHPKTILPLLGSLQLCLSLFLTEGDKCLKIANRLQISISEKTATRFEEK